MGVHERMTGAERVAKRRAAQRAKGLKLRQYWLPDLTNPVVRVALAEDAKLIHRIDAAAAEGAFLESIRVETWTDESGYDWGLDGPSEQTTPSERRTG